MDLKNIAQSSLALCLKAGAQQAKVSIGQAQSLDTAWRKNDVETLQNSASSGIGFELYVDGRFASHHSSDLRSEALEHFIKRAVALTRLLEEDSYRKLPPSDMLGAAQTNESSLQLHDEALSSFTTPQARALLQSLEAHALDSTLPIVDVTTNVAVSTGQNYTVHSNGFAATRRTSRIDAYAEITLQDPSGKRPNAYYGHAARYLADLMTPQEIAAQAQRYAAYTLQQTKLPSGKSTLLFDNRVASGLISRYLAPIFGADIQQKRSYFEGKLGQTVASPLLSILDDPHLIRGLGSRLYDEDGFNTATRPILDNGELKNYFIDYYYALKLGVAPTTGSTTNLVVKPGAKSQAELIAEIDKGIFVTSFLGGNADRTTGDFSYGIAGVAIEQGKLTQNIAEMNFSGNFNTLMHQLSALGNDPTPSSKILCPSLRFDGVDVSGV